MNITYYRCPCGVSYARQKDEGEAIACKMPKCGFMAIREDVPEVQHPSLPQIRAAIGKACRNNEQLYKVMREAADHGLCHTKDCHPLCPPLEQRIEIRAAAIAGESTLIVQVDRITHGYRDIPKDKRKAELQRAINLLAAAIYTIEESEKCPSEKC